MEIERLVEQNQWWKDKSLIEEDYDIQKWKEKRYRISVTFQDFQDF